MSPSARQKTVFTALLLLSAAASFAGYRQFQGKFIAYHRAESLFLAGDFKSSIPLFTRALALGLTFPAAYRHLGDAYLATNDFQAAVEPYRVYTAKNASDFETLGKLADVYDLLGQEQKALELLEKSLSINREQPALWLALARLRQSRKEYLLAEKSFLRALELKPDLAAAVYGLAETLAWQKQYDRALDIYRAYLAKHPEDRTARLNLAKVLSWRGDLDLAIRQYDLALEKKK